MTALVGYTGFVGSNILEGSKGKIQEQYNSKNIETAYGTSPDLLIYAGLRAEKYLANREPEADWKRILQAEENISRIAPKKLVLISTIDVFSHPKKVDEKTTVESSDLQPYGRHRLLFEKWVRDYYPDALILRLPALYGKNLKKNFIYDFIHLIPAMLTVKKMQELSDKEPKLLNYYELQENGFYRLNDLKDSERENLKDKYRILGFTALNFTDSRSRYQFYNLNRLWDDIQRALMYDLHCLHLATEPISAGELYQYLTGEHFINELEGTPADYDYRTLYGKLFGKTEQYICGRELVLKDIKNYICSNTKIW